jgi:hypothetical protein
MHRLGHYWRTTAISVLGGALTITAIAANAASIPAQASQARVISPTPANGTPQLSATSSTQVISQLVQCGGKMYAVGSFNSIKWKGATYSRNNIFSFSATAPYAVSKWAPDVNGPVNTIAFQGSDCSHAYIGGTFRSVNGVTVSNLAKISTATGSVNASFAHDASKAVNTMVVTGTHLLTGGAFKTINGSSQPYYVSLNTTSGRNDGYLNLNISGHYVYPHAAPNGTSVDNQQLSHNGQLLLAEGHFTSVGGQARQQIFMLSLGGQAATVTGWTSPEFNQHCATTEPFYVRAAAWSPSDSNVYIATTGLHPNNWNHKFPLTGLCDAAAAFSAGQTSQNHEWINYMGCDSVYSVAADTNSVFVAGHPRWSQNENGCNHPGKGSVPDVGLQGLVPATGKAQLNSNGSAMYSMGRANADDMIITAAGLWIASTNRFGTSQCGGSFGHAGICFLPYT